MDSWLIARNLGFSLPCRLGRIKLVPFNQFQGSLSVAFSIASHANLLCECNE